MIEIKAPEFPESIADGEVAVWHVEIGESVKRDDILVDIETDKVVLEVVAPADGVLTNILKAEGETILAEEVLAEFEAGEVSKSTEPETMKAEVEAESEPQASGLASPAARKMAEENQIDVTRIGGTGKGGRVTKEDILKAVAAAEQQVPQQKVASQGSSAVSSPTAPIPGERVERRVPMTRLRASIARRLVDAQQTAAMLTTFNEVDLTEVMALRNRYKDKFEKEHGVRLGFMSFFAKAVTEALKKFPVVNASVEGTDVIYHNYYDIGVAVSTERGLMVPVLRDVDQMGFAEFETELRAIAKKAQEGSIGMEELTGGTFTITNGGVFGSMMSTPILNQPQSAILGMHTIQQRPMVIDGEIVARPMMYVALTYDHRIIDGKDSVQFLVAVKQLLEDPSRLLLQI
jgi:2-oxoglutarate dehydrogenase E2 component (dihydrolipoamide succinyltransferase)